MIQTACRVYPLLSLVLCSVFCCVRWYDEGFSVEPSGWRDVEALALLFSLKNLSLSPSVVLLFCMLSNLYRPIIRNTMKTVFVNKMCVCVCVSLWLSSINFRRQPSEQNRTEAGPFADGLDPAGQLGHRSDRHRGPHRTRQPCGACQARSGGRRLDGNTGEGVQRDAIHELSSRR